MILQHDRKDSPQAHGVSQQPVQRSRGHTSIIGSVDTHLDFVHISEPLIQVSQGKNRLAQKLTPFRLQIEGTREDAFVRVKYAGASQVRSVVRTKSAEARDFVTSFLAASGRVLKKRLVEEATQAGIKERSLEKAISDLGAAIVHGFDGKEAWYELAEATDGGPQ